MNESEAMARHRLVELVQAMLNGAESFFEGAVQVLALKNQVGGIADRDADFDVFVAIVSESNHLPLKQQHSLWSPEELKRLEPEFNRTEEWASSFAPAACKSLIARFKGNETEESNP
ncbi:DUF2489 domain-containing protein [Noviherbaspirillum aerium]|uniref:DUF2489 domain-containing protein n=1 Tax=Noviherbaspirillum aerium TaxID=2588497 RepID=UPI00124DC1B2|nr:DUF2489 domain-containing protein [Noviherbaspirillum aerium]